MATTVYVLRSFGGVLIIQSNQSQPAPLPTFTVVTLTRDGIVRALTHDGIAPARTRDGITPARTP